MHAYVNRKNSKWSGYLDTLPKERSGGALGVSLPLEWTADAPESTLLRHSEAARILERADRRLHVPGVATRGVALRHIKQYFDTVGLLIWKKATGSWDLSAADCERLTNAFIGAWTIVSSRSFILDTFHGLVLAPFADLFNHVDNNQVQFECVESVCEQCGALDPCPHYTTLAAIRERDGVGEGLELEPDNTIHMTLRIPLEDRDHTDSECEEIFNSYGNLSNARLLVRYGFSLPEGTDYERFSWDWEDRCERQEILAAFELSEETGAHGSRTVDQTKWEEIVSSRIDHFSIGKKSCQDWANVALARLAFPTPIGGAHDGHEFLSCPTGGENESESDRDFPLFVDGEGRVSVALWRLACLAAIAQEDHVFTNHVTEILPRLEGVLQRSSEGKSVYGDSADDRMMRSISLNAFGHLLVLVRGRRRMLSTGSVDGEQQALTLISADSRISDSMRNVLYCVLIEGAALRACTYRIGDLLAAFRRHYGNDEAVPGDQGL